MQTPERNYLNLLADVLERGERREDRTGTGTLSLFGAQCRYDLRQGFPLLTTKKVHWPSVAHELFWFLEGRTNTKGLSQRGVKIWDEWADADGELGPIYGKQWRSWHSSYRGAFDQIRGAIACIKTNPTSRRMVVSAWNVAEIDLMALPPCHVLFQFYVSNDRRLSCQMYQRSADLFLGVPFNIASYALLTHLIAHVCDLEVGDLVHTLGDAHIYLNHIEQVKEQLTRTPRALPRLMIREGAPKDIDALGFDDVGLLGYEPWPAIKGEVSV